MKEFQQPTGVVDVQLDKATNRLATPTCPDDYTSAFVAGTEPHDTCDAQAGDEGVLFADVWREISRCIRSRPRPTSAGPEQSSGP